MRPNKTYLKYLAMTKRGHIWTEQEIIYFRKYVNGSIPLDIDSIEHLIASVDGKYFRITNQQTVKGILWLKNKCFKNNGSVRKACPLKPFERAVIQSFKEFRFVGLYNVSDNSYRNYMPVYRVVATNGMYFDYVAYSWGEMKVITIGNKKTRFETWCNQPNFENERLGA
jgi:hypothetical protein